MLMKEGCLLHARYQSQIEFCNSLINGLRCFEATVGIDDMSERNSYAWGDGKCQRAVMGCETFQITALTFRLNVLGHLFYTVSLDCLLLLTFSLD